MLNYRIYYIAKNFIILFFISLLPLFSVNTFNAKDVDFAIWGNDCKENRTFDIEFFAESDLDLAALKVILEYDSEFLEYKSMTPAIKTMEKSVNEKQGEIITVILSAQGYEITKRGKIATFRFKALKSGNTYVNLTVGDVVTPECKRLNIGEVYGCTVKVDKSGTVTYKSKSKSTYSNKSNRYNNNNKTNKKEYSRKSTTSYSKNTTTVPTYTTNKQGGYELLENNNTQRNDFILGVIVTVAVVLVFLVAYRLGTLKAKKKDSDDNKK